jgi:hypothetical protein
MSNLQMIKFGSNGIRFRIRQMADGLTLFVLLQIILYVILQIMPCSVHAQKIEKPFTLTGYLTLLQSTMFDSLSGSFLIENILHNRLNFRGYVGKNITMAAEIRTRFFTGDRVKMGETFSGMIGEDPGYADFSLNLWKEQSFLLNTTIDRLWVDLRMDKVQLILGRQRINWGQTLVWNPNDIFNAYSFFDFDYVERPGSDALRIQYYPTFSSALELALKANREGEITAAGLYRFNRLGYDFQFLAGVADGHDLVAGAGWSGHLGSLAFRGEGSWFDSFRGKGNKEGTLILTAGLDKSYKNNSMAQLQLMVCNNPFDLNDFTSLYYNRLSSRDLAYSRFSAFGQYVWSVTPLLNLSLSGMWFPDLNGWFAGPSLDYSLAENLDFSLIGQHFEIGMNGIKTILNLVFLRAKYSF